MKLFNRDYPVPPTIYYPNNIGSSREADEYDYEFLVTGKSVPESQNRIIGTLLFHGAKLKSVRSNIDHGDEEFTLGVCANLEESDAGPKTISTQIQKLDFVGNVEYKRMSGRMFGSLFPLTLYDKERAVLLNSKTMINLSKRLAKDTGSAGTQALFLAGREYASEVIKDIQDMLDESEGSGENEGSNPDSSDDNGNEPEGFCVKCRERRKINEPSQVMMRNGALAIQGSCPVCTTKMFRIGKIFGTIRDTPLIRNVQGFLIASGWGAFQLRSEVNGRALSVTVLDPPTLGNNGNGESYSCNQFLEGIASAFLEGICNNIRNELALIGERYDSKSRIMTMQFAEHVPVVSGTAGRRAKLKTKKKKPQPSVAEQQIASRDELAFEGQATQAQANMEAQEVDKIIRSLEEIEAQTRDGAIPKAVPEASDVEGDEKSVEIVVKEGP